MKRIEELIYKEIITYKELAEIKANKKVDVKFMGMAIILDEDAEHYTVTLEGMDFHIYVM